MLFNTTELDDAEPIKEYTKEPTRWEAMKASMDNFTSVNLSTSEMNYYSEQKETSKQEWITANPTDKDMYDRVLGVDKKILEQLDTLYDSGDHEAIENWHSSTATGMVDVGGLGIGKDYLRFRETQSVLGLGSTDDIRNTANDNALADFNKSKEVLDASDYWGMEMIGTMAGALQDPITLATLPLGSFKAGGTILTNAGKAFLEEAKIESMAQAVIAPKAYGFKTELGIKTSIATEATNAVTAIVGAGLLRGVGSSAFDLTAKGMAHLKVKDPELAADYEQLVKGQATEDTTSHIDNLQKVEFGGEVAEIKNPNAKGEELNNADYIPEVNNETIIRAKELKVDDTAELTIHSGEDEAGQPIFKTYKELSDEIDAETKSLQGVEKCLM